jgi:poly-gamma-glutamate synthesis protein (capsule biosynthesis protein)
VAVAGGDTLVIQSLGNFMFDQTGPRASGALAEVTRFAQGTVFLRQLPLPGLYDIALGRSLTDAAARLRLNDAPPRP